MTGIIRNGWEIYFFTPLFAQQRRDLRDKIRELKQKLSVEEYNSHPDVKLLASVMRGIKEIIVLNPFAAEFRLKKNLRKYGRLKGYSIDYRHRLFFRAFEENGRKIIVILWLGFPRKEGDKNDCYTRFSKMVEGGLFPESVEELIKLCE